MEELHAGFDVGGSTIRLGLFDANYKLVKDGKRLLDRFPEVDFVMEQMRELYEELGAPPLSTIGVGLAAQLDASQTIIRKAPNLGWEDVPFRELLRAYFAAPAHLVNDLNAILAGERIAGAARGYSNVLAVYVGTGIGAAFSCDERIIFGASGFAGEIGHVKVEVGGRLCGCGQRGCVEAYVSGGHLADQLREKSNLVEAELRVVDPGLSLKELHHTELLAKADAVATDSNRAPTISTLWQRTSDMLAVTIANAVTLLNPGLLLLGGGVLENLSNYRQMTVAKILPQIVKVASTDLQITYSEMGSDQAGILGAAVLAVSDHKINL